MSVSATTAVPLTTQVGGHAGVMSSEDGSLVIKPCLPLERKFYETLDDNDAFTPLKEYVPKFFGLLKLEGKVEGSAAETLGEAKGEELLGVGKESLVLENLSHTFKKPNILDIKLGTVLYDESASEEKRARMIKTAKETTSFETGVRLTGFQVYDQASDTFVNTPKSYGKSIKVADLPEGVAKFFPVTSSDNTAGGVNAKLLSMVLRGVIDEVSKIRDILANIEMRMVGGSLLIVWEGEESSLKTSMDAACAKSAQDEADEQSDDDDAEDGPKIGPPFVVKLIDFAHTRIALGEGPDEGVVRGVDTTLKLLQERKKNVDSLT